MNINRYIDHTLLSATATEKDIVTLCEQAVKYDFFSVCVNSGYVRLAKKHTTGSNVKVCSVIGFPLGQMDTSSKIAETGFAVSNGADEIDMVINVGKLLEGDYTYVQDEISAIKNILGNRVLKVILETCYLNKEQIRMASTLSIEAGADYIKTSTGFGTGGATPEDVSIMLNIAGDKALVKASGGVRDQATAIAYIEMGVKRLGTSNGIKIMQGEATDPSSY